MMTFEAGQIWSYRTRPSEGASRVTVLREDHDYGEPVFTVAVDNLDVSRASAPDGRITLVTLAPCRAALEKSVIACLGRRTVLEDEIPPPSQEGFFAVPIAALLDGLDERQTVESAVADQHPPSTISHCPSTMTP